MSGSISLSLPANSPIKITGLTNSGSWGQQITIQTPGGPLLDWSSTGATDNKVVGQATIGPFSKEGQLIVVSMANDPGSGYQPSAVEADSFNMDGLSGYVVGGQDSGGRPSRDAYWNTVVLIYWAASY